VFSIRKAKDSDFDVMFDLMCQNMRQLQLNLGLSWDDESIKKHYVEKDNWIVTIDEKIVGFASFESQEEGLFVHTLQIEKSYQNRMIGYKVFKLLVKEARLKGLRYIYCCVFSNNKAKEMYSSLGFQKISEANGVLELELDLNNAKKSVLNRLHT